jgi:hypothetical protein
MIIHTDLTELQIRFLSEVFEKDGNNPYGLRFDDKMAKCKDPLVSEMIARFIKGETAVLPYNGLGDKLLLLVLNDDERQLFLHASELENFLVPVWAEPLTYGVKFFSPNKGLFGLLGSQLFPRGFVCFSSPVSLHDEVLKVLKKWVQLDFYRPGELSEATELDVYTLRRQFHEAITIKNWDEAFKVLGMLRQGHWLSDENNSFLKIQLLGAQGKWLDIWEDESFEIIAYLEPLPVLVRATLLKAFYFNIVLTAEKDGGSNAAVQALSLHRSRLGTLLRFRAGLEGDLFIRLFAYQAVLTENRATLERLLTETSQEDMRTLLVDLLKRVPDVVVKSVQKTPLALAKQYFAEGQYDEAYICLLDAPPSIQRTQLLLGSAAMSEDKNFFNEAKEAFQQLSEEDKHEVWNQPQSKTWANYVLGEKWKDKDGNEVILPNTWDNWFQAVLEDKPYLTKTHELIFSLESKRSHWDKWTLNKTTEALISLLVIEYLSMAQAKSLKIMLPDFAAYLLGDVAFPIPEFEELYEYTVEAMQAFCARNQTNTTIQLKLLEGLFKMDIRHCQDRWHGIEKWFALSPNMKLAGEVLDALELFHDYGMAADKLLVVYNTWVASLIRQLNYDMRTQVDTWYRLGKSLGANHDLIGRIEELLTKNPPPDPLANLSKMNAVIFSCREKAATRAAARLMERNELLKVEVCTSERMNDKVKAYVIKSDLAIIVTACTSHALTAGIAPYLKRDPIYPRSSGETGIIEALEEWAAYK